MKAKGLALVGPHRVDSIDEEIRHPGPGEVLIKVRASGVCKLDVNWFKGKLKPEGIPQALGHEGVGIVEEVGSGVTNVKPGDKAAFLVFDPVRGYSRKDRNLDDPRVREGIKEIAQMDGAIIVSADGTVEAACRYIDAPATTVTLSKGLGSRHWAAAAITRATKAVAVTVSQSNGTVRIFQNGEVMLRIEPIHRRPMVWKDFEYEPPVTEGRPKSKPEPGKPTPAELVAEWLATPGHVTMTEWLNQRQGKNLRTILA
jgi:hypothetical protein